MESHDLTRRIQSAVNSVRAFVRWLCEQETLEDAVPGESPPPSRKRMSFVRWLFSQEPLQKEEPTQQEEKKPSFVTWLLLPERLEPSSSEETEEKREPKQRSFFLWLFALEPLDSSPPKNNGINSESTYGA